MGSESGYLLSLAFSQSGYLFSRNHDIFLQQGQLNFLRLFFGVALCVSFSFMRLVDTKCIAEGTVVGENCLALWACLGDPLKLRLSTTCSELSGFFGWQTIAFCPSCRFLSTGKLIFTAYFCSAEMFTTFLHEGRELFVHLRFLFHHLFLEK